ncbi:MAG: hypothetical protein ACRD2X_00360, partial [Vicinamibacteraceae bacterium]
MATSSPPLLLIHGVLAERIGAEEFWECPGIAPGLRAAALVPRAARIPTAFPRVAAPRVSATTRR